MLFNNFQIRADSYLNKNNILKAERDTSKFSLKASFSIAYLSFCIILFLLTMFMDVDDRDPQEKFLYFFEKITSAVGLISILLFMKTRLEGLMLFSLYFLLFRIYKNQRANVVHLKKKETDHVYVFSFYTFFPLVALHVFLSVVNIFSTWLYKDNFIILPIIIGFICFLISYLCLLQFSINSQMET